MLSETRKLCISKPLKKVSNLNLFCERMTRESCGKNVKYKLLDNFIPDQEFSYDFKSVNFFNHNNREKCTKSLNSRTGMSNWNLLFERSLRDREHFK